MADVRRLVIKVGIEDGDQIKELTVRTDNRDLLAYERTRPKQNWPKIGDDGTSTWVTFLAWSALYRAGDTKLSMREFMEDRCLYADMDKQDVEEVDPTQTGQDTGS